MTFRFEYRYYKKLSINNEAGFFIIIDDEFDSIEYGILNSLNKIIFQEYYNVSKVTKEKIKNVLKSNLDIFNLNSYIYINGIHNDEEQLYYFHLNDKNRKIEGTNINYKTINNKSVLLILKVFDEISQILSEENIILKLTSLNKTRSC